MGNVSLMSAQMVRKNALITFKDLSLGVRGSLSQILKRVDTGSIYSIVDCSTSIPSLPVLKSSCSHWIVLTGSVQNQKWYIASFLDSETENLALIGGSRPSWIKALTFYMRFRRDPFKNWSGFSEGFLKLPS